MRQPKIDFRFLFHTSKNMYFKKCPFFNANLLEKYLFYLKEACEEMKEALAEIIPFMFEERVYRWNEL